MLLQQFLALALVIVPKSKVKMHPGARTRGGELSYPLVLAKIPIRPIDKHCSHL